MIVAEAKKDRAIEDMIEPSDQVDTSEQLNASARKIPNCRIGVRNRNRAFVIAEARDFYETRTPREFTRCILADGLARISLWWI